MLKNPEQQNFRKLLVLACGLILVALLLTGCGKPVVFDGSRVANDHGFHMEYSVLNREETAEMSLKEGDHLLVSYEQERGNIDIAVRLMGGSAIYNGAEQVKGEFVLTFPETGSYLISVTGHQAKGKIAFEVQ